VKELMRLTVAGEGCRGAKFSAGRWVDPLDVDGLHMCRFALRLLTGHFFDFAVELLKGKHFKVGHLCGEPDAVLKAAFDVDHERLLTGLG